MTRPANQRIREALHEAVNLPAVLEEIDELLLQQGRDPQERPGWKPVLAQIRISRAESLHAGASESPERQQSTIARYCVQWGFNPVAMCFETQSGYLIDEKPRHKFRRFFELIESGELPIDSVITYNIDRFTRHRLTGELWMRMLKRRGVDLHEADELDSQPRPLSSREDEYARAMHSAWRESKRTSKRVLDALRELSDENGMLGGVQMYGLEPILDMIDGHEKTIGGRAVPEEVAILQEAMRRIRDGERIYSIVCDLNERGVRTRSGAKFKSSSLTGPLTSPTICGLRRLRRNDENAEPELVRIPIEPICTEEEWLENCELLAPKRQGPRPEYPASGLGSCSVCGSSIIASGKHYKCSRKHLRNERRRCSRCGESGCRCSGRRTASDGFIHPTRQKAVVERFLIELCLAATDAARAAEAGVEAVGFLAGIAQRRAELEDRESRIHRERTELARQVRQGFVPVEEGDTELLDIKRRLSAVRAELHELQQREARLSTVTAEPNRLRQLAFNGKPHQIRHLLISTIDHFTLSPRDGRGAYDGIEVSFANGYHPPAEAVEALRAELNAEAAHQEARRLRTRDNGRFSLAAKERAFELWSAGLSHGQIAEELNREGLKRPRRPDSPWTPTVAGQVVVAVCTERGIPYSSNWSAGFDVERVLSSMHELVRQGLPWPEIAQHLNVMGLRTRRRNPWTATRAKDLYRRQEHLPRTATPSRSGGRPLAVPPQMRRTIWFYKRDGHTYRQTADWLNGLGVRRSSGVPWDEKSVQAIVYAEQRRIEPGDAPGIRSSTQPVAESDRSTAASRRRAA